MEFKINRTTGLLPTLGENHGESKDSSELLRMTATSTQMCGSVSILKQLLKISFNETSL